ncbi:MAG: NAD(P)/FAD-dependent oxidoreductase [Luteimonas sp.]
MAASDGFEWDVVVVGASFGGAACALAAREAGLRVCVLERKRDPGIKLHTTGIIVKEAAENTRLARIPRALVHRVERVRLYSPNLRSIALRVPGYYFLTTDTPNVMRWLTEELRSDGVDVRLMQPFTDAKRLQSGVRGETCGWTVEGLGRTRYLVGADGAKSRVARRLGLGAVSQFLYGIEYEFVGASLAQADALHCFISKRYAPGYIGWAAQNPLGVQIGLAFRHSAARTGVPDIDGFFDKVHGLLGLERGLEPTAIRAGLVPCGGPVSPLTARDVMLTGDAAGIVSPVTAGGIHSAWRHGWRVGDAIAAHLTRNAPAPELVAITAAPKFRIKRGLRWAYDRFQMDWPFNLLLRSMPLRWAANQVYFDRRRHDDR